MRSLRYAFQFGKDVHIKVTNSSGGIVKKRQDYYILKRTQ